MSCWYVPLLHLVYIINCFFFFFNDPATTEIYTLSLHDALPIPIPSNSKPRPRPSAGGPPSARKLKARVQELEESLARLRAERVERQALLECHAHVINELSIDYEQVKAERDTMLGNVRPLAGRTPRA